MQKNLNQEKQTAKHTPTTVVQYCTVTTHQWKIEESTVSKKIESRERKKRIPNLRSTVQYSITMQKTILVASNTNNLKQKADPNQNPSVSTESKSSRSRSQLATVQNRRKHNK
jgi:hypothetical protein